VALANLRYINALNNNNNNKYLATMRYLEKKRYSGCQWHSAWVKLLIRGYCAVDTVCWWCTDDGIYGSRAPAGRQPYGAHIYAMSELTNERSPCGSCDRDERRRVTFADDSPPVMVVPDDVMCGTWRIHKQCLEICFLRGKPGRRWTDVEKWSSTEQDGGSLDGITADS